MEYSDEYESNRTILYIDDVAVGCVQKINLQVEASQSGKLYLEFPDFENLGEQKDNPYKESVAESIKDFSLPNVTVQKKNLDDGVSNPIFLTEVGTFGRIHAFPMKR